MNDEMKRRLDPEALATVERRIVEALPEIVEGLVGRARQGDVRAAAYLIDRILGKTTAMKAPPAERDGPNDKTSQFPESIMQFIQRVYGGGSQADEQASDDGELERDSDDSTAYSASGA